MNVSKGILKTLKNNRLINLIGMLFIRPGGVMPRYYKGKMKRQ